MVISDIGNTYLIIRGEKRKKEKEKKKTQNARTSIMTLSRFVRHSGGTINYIFFRKLKKKKNPVVRIGPSIDSKSNHLPVMFQTIPSLSFIFKTSAS